MGKNNKDSRVFFKKRDLIFITIIIIISFAVMFLLNSSTSDAVVAQISYEGKIIKEIDLKNSSDMIFNLLENNRVSFEIKAHAIRFVNIDCPDKLCENCGFLNKANQVAICLPNKVSLRIIGNNNDIDIIVN